MTNDDTAHALGMAVSMAVSKEGNFGILQDMFVDLVGPMPTETYAMGEWITGLQNKLEALPDIDLANFISRIGLLGGKEGAQLSVATLTGMFGEPTVDKDESVTWIPTEISGEEEKMQYTKVEMKDGATFEGPIYFWSPKEGWFTLGLGDQEKIYFRDVASAVTPGVRIHVHTIEDRDELVRAREDGWVDKEVENSEDD